MSQFIIDLSLAELFPVLSHFGRYTVPLPVAQTIMARALVASTAHALHGAARLGSRKNTTSNS